MVMYASRDSFDSSAGDEETPLLSHLGDDEVDRHDVGWTSEPLRLPAGESSVAYESWTIMLPRGDRLGRGRGRGITVTPNTHFDQEELSIIYHNVREKYRQRRWWKQALSYETDLQRRLSRLESDVQLEIYDLLKERTVHTSNDFRRRGWKLIALAEVPGGEMTDAAPHCHPVKRRRPQALTEYHVLLRGREVKRTERGWPFYNRHTQPWYIIDRKALASKSC